MAETTIAWTGTRLPDGSVLTGFTYNPWHGCFKVSDGCKNCYAETLAKRFGHNDIWGPAETTKRRKLSDAYWKQPLNWNISAERMGIRRKVFCGSMCDVFEDNPAVDKQRERLWPLIEQTPWLDWLLLTKRPENIMKMLPYLWRMIRIPDNVWMGTSVENQHWADVRIPQLLDVPVRTRFLSCEPLLGPVDLHDYFWEPAGPAWAGENLANPWISWVITGGESGPKHRLFKPEWAISIRDQCQAAGVSYFHKQNGGLTSHSGGHLLDGQEYMAWPE